MKRVPAVLAVALFLASAAHAQLSFPPRRLAANLGTCVDDKPRQAFVTNGASSTDCSAGGGTTEVLCCCANGAWAACGSGGGGAPTGAAGGGLGGSYPNPTVDDDGHAHGTSTISGLDAANDIASGTLASGRLSGSYSINAATCTALAANPADCSAGQFGNAIAASGDLTCAAVNFTNLAGSATDSQVPNLEDLSTGCASGELLKADAGGDIICGSAGSASFSTFDGDYGAETVTSAWDLSGALLELPNSTAPTSGDCDAAGEAGRVHVDTNAPSGEQLYVCEGAAGWQLQGSSGGGSSEYDPDTHPTACDSGTSLCDEFAAGFEETWQAFNTVSGATFTQELGTAVLRLATPSATSKFIGWYLPDITTGVDFTFTAKFAFNFTSNNNQAGLIVQVSGTVAAPTKLEVIRLLSSGNSIDTLVSNDYAFAGFSGHGATSLPPSFAPSVLPANWSWQQYRYVAATKVLTGAYSTNGYDWVTLAAPQTLTVHPVRVGIWILDNSTTGTPSTRWALARFRTDATGAAAPYPPGE
jgi:hypothetical protein